MSAVKILLVEDAAIVAEDIAIRLRAMGYTDVDIVPSGEEAIALARTKPVNLVIMDILLQGEMDGVEAAQRIHSSLGIPIIFVTANTDDHTLDRAKATAPFGYILKPLRSQELRAAIEIALDRHKLEVEAQRALTTAQTLHQQAQTFMQRSSEYLSMVSHELRSPLAGIQTSVQLLQRYSHRWSETTKQQYLQRIQVQIESLNRFIDDMLMLGKVESGQVKLRPTPIHLVSFCQEVLATLTWSLSDRLSLNLVVDDDCGTVYLDQQLLWHLLHNLLANAIKYSPEGGVIQLQISTTPTTVCFQIHDQGIGIPFADQQRLFEPFHRASNVGKIPGTGLGLAIVKRSLDLQRGQITLVSEPGHGTTVTVVLPRSLQLEPVLETA